MDSIILYSQPGCGQCKMIKILLTQKGINFDICEDIDSMQQLGISQTPTLLVNGVKLSGEALKTYIKTGIVEGVN